MSRQNSASLKNPVPEKRGPTSLSSSEPPTRVQSPLPVFTHRRKRARPTVDMSRVLASSRDVLAHEVVGDSESTPLASESTDLLSHRDSVSSESAIASDDSDPMWLDSDDLSQDDRDVICAFAMRHELKLSNIQYTGITGYMHRPSLPSIKRARLRMAKLSGVTPIRLDCCINVCCCFTGKYAELDQCPFCHVSRRQSDGKPRKQFFYLPCTARLRSLYASRSGAERMRYRSKQSQQHDGRFRDFTDGKHYRGLCQEHVVIDGKVQTFYYFADARDVALALSADGVCPFRNRRVTCWPLILINLNLPSEERYLKHNIIPLGIIPGPKQPRDLDSFLVPFFTEMLELAAGVDAFDALTDSEFDLHAYLLLVFGDLQAMSKLLRMKGVNGRLPCRFCRIRAISDPTGSTPRTCYCVHDRRNIHGERSYDPGHLPLRNDAEMRRMAAAVDAAPPSQQKTMSKETGIKGTALLARLPGISLPYSFPCEFMHLVWINLISLLVSLYSSDSKGLGEGNGEYRLNPLAWEQIGRASKAAGDTIPSAFGCRIPNLAEESGYRTAEMWSVWTQFVAPAVLKGRFRKDRYYDHFMDLATVASKCIQLEVSAQDVQDIRSGFIQWVQDYEKYFYQYDPARVSLCTSIVHYLLHIADCIEFQGPVWVYWAFVMERHCGRVARAVGSRRQPWASLNNFVLAETQLQTVMGLYNLDETFLRGPIRAERQAGMFFQVAEYPTCELVAPSQVTKVTVHLATLLANSLSVWYCRSSDKRTTDAIKRHLPREVREWGKVRRLDGGDMMHAADLVSHEERDMTFVRYEQMVDKFARSIHRRPEFERCKFYGQLRRIIVLEVAPELATVLGPKAPGTILIAVVSECLDISEPDAYGMQFYSTVKTGTELMELRAIECVVGRVRIHDGRWAIVDRSDALSRVLFTAESAETEPTTDDRPM